MLRPFGGVLQPGVATGDWPPPALAHLRLADLLVRPPGPRRSDPSDTTGTEDQAGDETEQTVRQLVRRAGRADAGDAEPTGGADATGSEPATDAASPVRAATRDVADTDPGRGGPDGSPAANRAAPDAVSTSEPPDPTDRMATPGRTVRSGPASRDAPDAGTPAESRRAGRPSDDSSDGRGSTTPSAADDGDQSRPGTGRRPDTVGTDPPTTTVRNVTRILDESDADTSASSPQGTVSERETGRGSGEAGAEDWTAPVERTMPSRPPDHTATGGGPQSSSVGRAPPRPDVVTDDPTSARDGATGSRAGQESGSVDTRDAGDVTRPEDGSGERFESPGEPHGADGPTGPSMTVRRDASAGDRTDGTDESPPGYRERGVGPADGSRTGDGTTMTAQPPDGNAPGGDDGRAATGQQDGDGAVTDEGLQSAVLDVVADDRVVERLAHELARHRRIERERGGEP